METTLFINCPVCDMVLDNKDFKTSYLSIQYHFCSKQCERAFQQHPHLYLGRPGKKLSVKKQGQSVVKSRILKNIKANVTEAQFKAALSELMGILKVTTQKATFEVKYDLLEATLADIFLALESAQLLKPDNLLARLRRAYIYYIEDNERSNLEDETSSSCH